MHLLVVDNDRDILDLLRLGLEELGYRVTTVESGLEALRAIEREIPEVIVTDLIMPNISGDKLLRIVDSVPAWKQIRTIVLSGIAKEAPEVRPNIPCDVYIAKGPIARTIALIDESIRQFALTDSTRGSGTVGLDQIYSRRITRELLDFKRDVDLILDSMSDGVCKLDPGGVIIWTNRQFCRLVGETEERVLGRAITDFLTPENHAAIMRAIAQEPTENAEAASGVAATIRPTERIVRARVLYGLGRGDGEAAVLWRDVTAHLLAEEQFENIVESSNEVIWATDRSGRITFLSGAARRAAQWVPENLMGRPIWSLAAEEDRDRVRNDTRAYLANLDREPAAAIHTQEWRILGADGEIRWIENRISPLRARGTAVIGMQGALADITERRRHEEERAALLHEVHHRVRDNLQLIGSLARMSDPPTLERRIAAIGEAFDELYRERSFSRVEVGTLAERVAIGAVSALGNSPNPEVGFNLCDAMLPMRRAAPLSLALSDSIARLGVLIPPGAGSALEVELCPEGEMMQLRVTLRLPAGTSPEASVETDSRDELLSIFVDQLNGSLSITTDRDEISVTIRFPLE